MLIGIESDITIIYFAQVWFELSYILMYIDLLVYTLKILYFDELMMNLCKKFIQFVSELSILIFNLFRLFRIKSG